VTPAGQVYVTTMKSVLFLFFLHSVFKTYFPRFHRQDYFQAKMHVWSVLTESNLKPTKQFFFQGTFIKATKF